MGKIILLTAVINTAMLFNGAPNAVLVLMLLQGTLFIFRRVAGRALSPIERSP